MWSTAKSIIVSTVNGWIDDRGPSMGAALAYYTLFSLGPILLTAIGIASWVWGDEASRGAVIRQVEGLIGKEGAVAVDSLVATTAMFGSGWLGTIIGLVTFFVTATAVFVQLQDDLNTIFESERKQTNGIIAFIWQRLISFAMLIALGFILMVSLALDAALASASEYFGMTDAEIVYAVANSILSWLLAVVVFGLIFSVLPARRPGRRSLIAGSFFSGTMFIVGKFLIAFYLGRADVVSGFGAAGSFVLILLWVYYSSQILFLGAEFTKAVAHVDLSPAQIRRPKRI